MHSLRVCTKCRVAQNLDQFYVRKRDGVNTWCSTCCRERAKTAYRNNPTYVKSLRATCALWRRLNSEWVRFQRLLKTYGLTLDQYAALEESQNFQCRICGGEGPFAVDHNHKTSIVRGLLCKNCNWGLGNFKDSPSLLQVAYTYLQSRGFYGREMGGA